jgi:predicted permease
MKLPWSKERAELDQEVSYHIETLADTFEAEGMSRDEALRRARREFGGVEQVKEECRAESRWNWLVHLQQDLRFGWRMMRKSPAVSAAAVVSLALGIGATTAIFSFADAVLWRKIAVPAPDRMIEVHWESKARPEGLLRGSVGSNFTEGGMRVADFFSKPGYEAIRDRAAGKLDVAAHFYPQQVSATFTGNVTVSRLRAVSGNFFSTLRIKPFAGRLLGESSPEPDLVVSYGFWERKLSRSEKAIGETIRINNYPYVIVGILPLAFFGLTPGDEVDLYTTISQSPTLLAPESWYRSRSEDPLMWYLQLIARRAPGVSMTEAQAVVNTAFAASWPAQPKSAEQTPRIRLLDASTGLGGIRRQLGDPVSILLGLVSMVLLVACANIANLLLARAAEREKEVALRVSLGCGSGRLMRQFLTESLGMAALGGALSVGVALGIGSLMGRVLPQGLDAASLMVELNFESLGITAAVTLVTVLLFGLYPAWRASRLDAAPALKEGTGSAGTASRGRFVPAKLLVVAQVALGVLLVMGGIVFTGNLSEIVNRDAGFERGHALLFDLRPGEVGYQDQRLATFYREIEDRMRAIPGVAEVGLSQIRPMRGGGRKDTIRTPGNDKSVSSAFHYTTSGFIAALGVPIIAGRGFTAEEVHGERRVAVISEQLARELNLASPLGARILSDGIEWEVVGVARNASYRGLTEAEPVVYIPLEKGRRSLTVLLRTRVRPLAVVAAAREAVRSLDRNIPLVDVFTMEQQISRTLQRERMFAWLCGSFGVLALVLCVVGMYGLMSHATARRTPEIGIRMALGASGRKVMRQVLSEGMRLAAAGMVLGIPLAIYAAKLAQRQRMLPEGPIPYWTLASAIGVLLVSAFVAVCGPALRASSVDPMRALRQG